VVFHIIIASSAPGDRGFRRIVRKGEASERRKIRIRTETRQCGGVKSRQEEHG
jgi:hypothetical protein